MSPRDKKFDRYFVAHGAARHVKFRRLNTSERHAFFLGILSIAGQAPVRGCLLVGNLPAEPADIAQEADVHVKFAESALDKLRAVGVIYRDERHNCDRVHDFDDWNPAPRVDTTAAERQRRKRQRDGAVTSRVTDRDVTAESHATITQTEVEEEGKKKEREGSAGATSEIESLEQVLAVLAEAPRLHLDRVGIENAVRAWPDGDHVRAARTVVTWVTDPAFRGTNAARLLMSALEKQRPAPQAEVHNFRPRRQGQPSAEDFMRIARGEA